MAVSALELRPRSAIALFDSAIRLVARDSGLWALTLPGGALVTGAVLHLHDAVTRHQALLVPCLLLTAAWFARGFFQGAACHHLQQLLLAREPPSVLGSLKAALLRLPSLFITVTVVALFHLIALPITLGLYWLLYGVHLAAFAVTMQGLGAPVKVLQTASTLLGNAKRTAVQLRWLFLAQALLILDLHIAASAGVFLGSKLLGLDLSFAKRFVSLDHAQWWLVILCLGFTLFEPLRAAVAALLLLDGRVRQEGLDLLAAIEHLPRRERKRSAARASSVALLLAIAVAGAGATAARAQDPDAEALQSVAPPPLHEIQQRLLQLAADCEVDDPAVADQLRSVEGLTSREQTGLSRFLHEVESAAYDDDDCEGAAEQLKQAAPLLAQTRDALRQRSPQEAAARARDILQRPEFAPIPPDTEPEKQAPAETWWERFWQALERWLRESDRTSRRERASTQLPSSGGGSGFASLLLVVLIAAVVGVLAWLILRKREQATGDGAAGDGLIGTQLPVEADPQNALSRPPEGWAHLADELAARGEYREAVRSLYLALLSRLHRDGVIDYDPTLSNWDYFRQFKRSRASLDGFRELTFRFDFTYYGNLGATAEGYAVFRQLSQPFLTPTPAAEARVA